jgi:hypothetical protein
MKPFMQIAFVSLLLLACHAPFALAITHIVDPGGNGDCTAIGPCIEMAADGDTILVSSHPETTVFKL